MLTARSALAHEGDVLNMLKFKSRKGFSTIEILIAVALVGILAAVGIPRLLDSRKTVSDSAAKQQLNTVLLAANNFFAERDTYTGLSNDELQQRLPEIEIVAAGNATGKGTGGRNLKVSVFVKADGTAFTMAASNSDGTCWGIQVSTTGTFYGYSTAAATGCHANHAAGWTASDGVTVDTAGQWQQFNFPNVDEA